MFEWRALPGETNTFMNNGLAVMWQGGATDIANRITEVRGPADVLEVFLTAGIRNSPEFCVSHIDDETLITYLRGSFSVHIEQGFGDPIILTGEAKRSWLESKYEGVTRIVMSADREFDGRKRLTATGTVLPSGLSRQKVIICENLANQTSIFTPDLGRLSTENFPEEIFVSPQEQKPEVVQPNSNPYDSLFEATMFSSVETAAVREQEEQEMSGAGVSISLPDGSLHKITKTTLLGRKPAALDETPEVQAELITVLSAENNMSRTHARITLEDGAVFVEDLNSTNGTLLIKNAGAKSILRPHVKQSVEIGDQIDLGGGTLLTFVGDS